MKTGLRILLAVLAISATLYSGVNHGLMRHDMGFAPDLALQVKYLETMPSEFGQTPDGRPAWVLVGEKTQLGDEIVEILECNGNVVGLYQSSLNPRILVHVTLLVGPSGPLLVHSPEVCYPSRGNKKLSDPKLIKVRGPNGEAGSFKEVRFLSQGLNPRQIIVGYAFSTGEGWATPKNERLSLAGSPFLYKVQLHCELPNDSGIEDETHPLELFLSDFYF